ncbi:MAG: M56 family metallopeptidase [Clostridia bacterium]|nr:M56 family metallopeptidase [Clostridia bacterium]
METVFLRLVNMSLAADWLVLAVVAVRLLFKKAPKWLHCLLWALVAVRLVCPFTVESLFSLLPSAQPIPDSFITAADPTVDTGMSLVDGWVNAGLSGSLSTSPENSVNKTQVLAFVATGLWAVGMVAMALYALVSTLRLRRHVRESIPYQPGVRLCDAISAPFILGVFRPCVYLPANLPREQVPHVLAHEQAHLRRFDHWWKPLGWLLLTVYWFNPLLWLAYILLCRDIELACDEKVIRELAADGRKAYSEALLACSAPRRLVSACPLAFGETGVKQRIKSILHYKKPAFWVVLAAGVACVAVAVCFLTNPPSTKVDEALDRLIVDTVKTAYKTDKVDDRCPSVAYTVFGTKKEGETVTVYGRLLYREYSVDERTDLHVEYSKPTPFTLTAQKGEATYSLVEYWTPPKDDTGFEAAIRERFPRRYQRRALKADAYADAANNEAACLEIARGYFGIADREDYTTYLCDVNGTAFTLEREGNRCTFTASQLASYRCEGTYRMDSDRVTLVFDKMTLVFVREGAGLVFDAEASDAIPKELHFGKDYSLPDGTLFLAKAETVPSDKMTVTYTKLTHGGETAYHDQNLPTTDGWAPSWYITDRAALDKLVSRYSFAPFDVAAYDEAFFAEKALFLIYMQEGSGAVRHQLEYIAYGLQKESMHAVIGRTLAGSETDDMNYWLMAVSIDKAVVSKVNTVSVTLREPVSAPSDDKQPDAATASFTGKVLEVMKGSGDLLLRCTDGTFGDQVEVRLDSFAGCLPAVGDEVRVTYNGTTLEIYPPVVYAHSIVVTVFASEPAHCEVGFYESFVSEKEIGKAVAKYKVTLTGEDYLRVRELVVTGKTWMYDALLDRLPLQLCGYLAFGDGRQYYVDLLNRQLYDAKNQMLATLTEEDVEFLSRHCPSGGVPGTGTSTTATTPNASNPFWGLSTRAGNPTTAPNRAPNAKGVVNIVDWTDIYAPGLGAMQETFYVDEHHTYYFTCVKSQYIFVYYADDSFKLLRNALADGDVTPQDIAEFGIEFFVRKTK